MRSTFLRFVSAPVLAASLSGCAFVQMTDHAFLGSPYDPPTHANREWIGAVVLPLAVTGDILTAPVQVVVLMIRGDFGIYAHRNEGGYRASLIGEDDVRVARAELGSDEATGKLMHEVEARAAAPGAPVVALGVDRAGNVTEIPLTAAQQLGLLSRANIGG